MGGSSRGASAALCLSKRLLLARAEAALLWSFMLQSNVPDSSFQVSPEMLQNGTGLSLTRLARFQDFKLDWLVLGIGKCGTTSLQYNLGLHPDIMLKSTHTSTFSHSLLYSASRFLPLHKQQRHFSNHLPSKLPGHPDEHKMQGLTSKRKNSQNSKNSTIQVVQVGCSLVSDLKPIYEEGTGNLLSSLNSNAAAEHFLYPFMLSTLLSAKPRLKIMFVIRESESFASVRLL